MMLVVLGGEPRRLAEVGRPRVLDCNSTGHLYNLRPRSLESAFPGSWGKGKKKKLHSQLKDEIALEQRREKVSGGVRGRRRKQGVWRKPSMRSLLMTLESFTPFTTRGRASSSTRSQTLPS